VTDRFSTADHFRLQWTKIKYPI